MNRELLKAESRMVWRWYLPLLAVQAGYVLVVDRPLGTDELYVGLLAAVQGMMLALGLFSEHGGTQSFLWSRPMTRRRLFLHRWGLGLAFQGLTLAALFLLLAGGVRSTLHVWRGNPYFPMVRWFELTVLWPVAVYSLFAYQLTLFLKVYVDLTWGSADSVRGAMLRGTLLKLGGVGVPAILVGWGDWYKTEIQWTPLELVGYVAAAAVASTLAAAHAYRHTEVEP